jgi:hypothetical protein
MNDRYLERALFVVGNRHTGKSTQLRSMILDVRLGSNGRIPTERKPDDFHRLTNVSRKDLACPSCLLHLHCEPRHFYTRFPAVCGGLVQSLEQQFSKSRCGTSICRSSPHVLPSLAVRCFSHAALRDDHFARLLCKQGVTGSSPSRPPPLP